MGFAEGLNLVVVDDIFQVADVFQVLGMSGVGSVHHSPYVV